VQTYGKIDSKFRFVILAAKRAKQLLRGAKVKIKTKTRNPIRIAQLEVREGVIDYEILKTAGENLLPTDEQVFTPDDDGADLDVGAGSDEEDYEEESEREEGEEEEEESSEEGGGEEREDE